MSIHTAHTDSQTHIHDNQKQPTGELGNPFNSQPKRPMQHQTPMTPLQNPPNPKP